MFPSFYQKSNAKILINHKTNDNLFSFYFKKNKNGRKPMKFSTPILQS